LNGAIAGLGLSGFSQFVLFAWALRHECSRRGITIQLGGIARERRILYGFTVPAALSGFTSMLSLWLAGAFLVRQPGGYSQMAMYGASFSLMGAVLFLPSIANNVGMSVINHSAGNPVRYRQSFWINLAVTLGIVLFTATVAALVGQELLGLFGSDFKDGYEVLVILLVAAIPQGLSLGLYQIVPSQARMWLSFGAIAVPRDCLIVALGYWLVADHGARGLAMAYAISWTFALVVIVGIVYRIGLQPSSGGATS
jgi:hypothetical protein